MLTISTVIPTYNRAGLIARALKSALDQCLPEDEIIVVDNASTDNTEEVLEPYLDRIRYIRTPQNGAGMARNRGIAEATGDLIAFLDSDDEWMAGKLLVQRQLMEAQPYVLFSFSNFAVTDNNGNITRWFLRHWSKDNRHWDNIIGKGVPFSKMAQLPQGWSDFCVHIGAIGLDVMQASYILTSSLVVRRLEAGNALHFAEDVPTWEDWECFGRLSLKGLAAYLDCESTWQHGHSGERLTNANNLELLTTKVKLIERVWGSSQAFLKRYSKEYNRALNNARIGKIRELLSQGMSKAARKEISFTKNVPIIYRLIAFLPKSVLILLMIIRCKVRCLWSRS